MVFRDASEAVERIAESGIKSPFTFWVLLAVTCLGLIMAIGSFWLLNIQLRASQERYDRLFTVMEASAQADSDREKEMIVELKATRQEYAGNLKDVVSMLMEQSPTKLDEQSRQKLESDLAGDRVLLQKLEDRQNKILASLEQLTLYINGKTGR